MPLGTFTGCCHSNTHHQVRAPWPFGWWPHWTDTCSYQSLQPRPGRWREWRRIVCPRGRRKSSRNLWSGGDGEKKSSIRGAAEKKRKEKRRNDKGHSLHWQDRAAEEEITDGNRITHSLYFVFDDDLALINIVLGMCAPYVDKSGYHIDLLLLVHTRKRDVLPLFFRMR